MFVEPGRPGAPDYVGGSSPAPASSSGLGAAIAVSAGLDVLAGIFSYMAGDDMRGAAESRARMVRMEAEADAQRYAESAQDFKARQKLAFLKSGVALSGSPLDVLDESARVARENVSAIKARGEAQALDQENQGIGAQMQGRAALIGGISSAGKTAITGLYQMDKDRKTAETARNNTIIRPNY